MNVVAALLLAQLGGAPALPVAEEPADEILVMARRLAETRVDWSTRRRNGVMQIRRCKVVQSSGDKELDRVVCQAVRECASHIPPDARTGDPLPEFYACNQERSLAMGRALLDRREAAAGGDR